MTRIKELQVLRMRLKSGEYDGVHIMHAWLAIDELIELKKCIAAKPPNTQLKLDDPKCGFNKIGCTDYWVGTRKCDDCDWVTT